MYSWHKANFYSFLPPKGATGTQTNLSGKCGQLGFSQICGKTGSVDSDLQYLGTTNSHHDKGLHFKLFGYRGFINIM